MEQQQHKRRPRYKGTHPRRFEDKYKELNPEKYREDVDKIISQGKTPAGMHIPIMVPGNREILEPCGEYFRLNHSEADEETLAFIELVKSHPGKILAVLSGHLHFRCNCDLVPGIPQYVSSQGILGNINRYEIGV